MNSNAQAALAAAAQIHAGARGHVTNATVKLLAESFKNWLDAADKTDQAERNPLGLPDGGTDRRGQHYRPNNPPAGLDKCGEHIQWPSRESRTGWADGYCTEPLGHAGDHDCA